LFLLWEDFSARTSAFLFPSPSPQTPVLISPCFRLSYARKPHGPGFLFFPKNCVGFAAFENLFSQNRAPFGRSREDVVPGIFGRRGSFPPAKTLSHNPPPSSPWYNAANLISVEAIQLDQEFPSTLTSPLLLFFDSFDRRKRELFLFSLLRVCVSSDAAICELPLPFVF